MNKTTDITVILDRSGSMQTTAKDAIGGFNAFVESQKKAEGDAVLTLIQFDDQYQVDYYAKSIKEVQPLSQLTYQPRGSTALIDAMGRGIAALKDRMKPIKKEFRPNCIVVIITDGEENCSREWHLPDVNAMISKMKTKGVEFVFIGANQDAIKTGQAFGISGANSLSYANNALGTQAVFSSVGQNLTSYRAGAKMDMSFEAKDVDAQKSAGLV
jgi:Mg-chelatase subunit ChlD